MKQKRTLGVVLVLAVALTIPWVGERSAGADDTPAKAPSGGGTRTEAVRTAAPNTASSASDAANASASVPAGMERIAENDSLALYVDPKSTEMAVVDKAAKTVWYSNPQDRNDDKIATSYNKSQLGAQLLITAIDPAGKQVFYDNYTHSVQNGQFAVDKLEQGIKITYTMGNVRKGAEVIPKWISEDRFKNVILDRIPNKDDRVYVEERFKYSEDKKGYERRDASLGGIALQKVLRILKEIGYDEEQMAVDRAAYGETAEQEQFVVPVVYKLDGSRLVVAVPASEVAYPKKTRLQSISLLPFFGAAGQREEGYMLVPDGSGALIRLNNGKTKADRYTAPVYGADHSLHREMNMQNEQPVRLPVFGMKKDDRAFLAVIESRDAIANIEADISGKVNAYNSIYSSYTINYTAATTLKAGNRTSTVPLFQNEPYDGDIVVRYGFLRGESATYSGMAAMYREQLKTRYGLKRLAGEKSAPFYVELIGGITKRKFFLGIPYTALEPVTTFEQAEDILNELAERGVRNVKVRYTGWFNGGVRHELPDSIDVDGELGGRKKLVSLLEYGKRNGIAIYPDAGFMQAFRDTIGFTPSRDASRFITGKTAEVYPYNLASYLQDKTVPASYVLSPSKLPRVVERFAADFAKLPASGLSLRDMGNELNADYNENRVIDREEAKRIVDGQLEKLRGGAGELMIEGGNGYAAPYAKHIVDAPEESSRFFIEDETVPFYQIVFHGYADYAGRPINLDGNADLKRRLLHALEYGSNVLFSWFHADSSAVKSTEFNDRFSGDYRVWLEDAAALYGEIGPILNSVRTREMTDHRKLAEGVFQTTFEGGKSIVVNYNDHAVQIGDLLLNAEDYEVGGEVR